MEIDNVHKRPITLQGSGKKKGLGIGQKFNFRFDIEYEGKTECFFVEDEASMSSWVERTSTPPSRVGPESSVGGLTPPYPHMHFAASGRWRYASPQVGWRPAGAAQCAGHRRQLAAAHPRPAGCVVERPHWGRRLHGPPSHPPLVRLLHAVDRNGQGAMRRCRRPATSSRRSRRQTCRTRRRS